MQSRCLLLVLLLGWRSLCVLAERLDGSQFSGRASNEEEGRPGRDGCFFHLHYLVSLVAAVSLKDPVKCVFHQQRAPTDTSA